VGFSDDPRVANPHVPRFPECSLANQLQPARWLPAEFFDTGSEDHAPWSVLSFKTWITVYKPHVHAESGTVYGGPLGVRNLVFAASQMHQNIDFATQHQSPPRDILQLIQGPRRIWSDRDTRRELDSCVAALRTDIARSRTILQVTYQQRLLAWRAAIIHSAENTTGPVPRNQMEISVTTTSGVPKTTSLIMEMYEELVGDLQDDTDGQEDISRIVPICMEESVTPPLGNNRLRSDRYRSAELGNETGKRLIDR
jgi:hypothetical protein